MHNFENIDPRSSRRLDRRSFLRASGMIAASTITGSLSLPAIAQQGAPASTERLVNGRRKVGQLEVSSVGLGCHDITGTFYATAPKRPDMIAHVRAAHDRGVTFFDAAEAYGQLAVERILGEAVGPFRNQVVISSKFGWGIDPETGRMVGGLNSRPEHIRLAVDGMLAQKPWIVPIPGTTKMPHLLDNLGADEVRFTAAEVRELNAAVVRVPIHGARLSAGVLSLSGVPAPAKQR